MVPPGRVRMLIDPLIPLFAEGLLPEPPPSPATTAYDPATNDVDAVLTAPAPPPPPQL